MLALIHFWKYAVASIGLTVLAVGCSAAEEGVPEERGARESRAGGSWSPPEVQAPNGVGSYSGLGGEECSGGLKPGTKALGDKLKAQFKFSSYGGYSCRANTANPSQLSIHAVGRALDVMTSGSAGDQIANHLALNSKALGVEMIIWNHTIWRVNSSGASSKAYGGPNPHTDHVHVEVTPAVAQSGPGDAVDPDQASPIGTEPDPDTAPTPKPTPKPKPTPTPSDELDDVPIAEAPDREPMPSGTDPSGRCGPLAAMQLCGEAFLVSGNRCGVVRDACGTPLDCGTLPLFGCKAGETCGADKRCHGDAQSTCTPKPASQVCADAKSTAGVQCGVVPNGCGGSVSCDGEAGFGCKANEACSGNTCAATAAPRPPAETKPSDDDDDIKPKSKSDKDGDDSSSSKTKIPPPADGCSASTSASRGSSLPFLGLALALGLVRRRRSRAHTA